MRNGQPPKWAQKIIREVSREYHLAPSVNWRWAKNRSHSTGTAYWARQHIAITAGQGWNVGAVLFGQKLVLLHELAHLIAGQKANHSPEFYRIAFTLYRQYGLPINECKKAEYRYKPRNAKKGWRLSVGRVPVERPGPKSLQELISF